MKRDIYGKTMFVADLLIVSVWALFYKAQRNAIEFRAPYHFNINEFKNGTQILSKGNRLPAGLQSGSMICTI